MSRTKCFKITTSAGEVFPGLLIGGTLSDSRTGERCMAAASWVEISFEEHDAMCEALGLGD